MVWLRLPESARLPDPPIVLPQLLEWRGERNVYDVQHDYWGMSQGDEKRLKPSSPCKGLADWNQLWPTTEIDSLEGRTRYRGGDLMSRIDSGTDNVTPEDFRLRVDSPGHGAGLDGRDVGADVDLVGPGKAYDRWKKTSEYQQWLVDTGQVKK
jgi:hypothetical protein